jgi:hypothetical protein
MEILIQLFTGTLMAITSFIGGGVVETEYASNSVELGLRETSPKGEGGGFAIPASGCGVVHTEANPDYVHECPSSVPNISVDKPIMRLGDPVTVTWDPKSNVGCVLSNTVMKLITSPNPSTAPNPSVSGSRVDEPTGETMYTITCTGGGNTDNAIVKILPRYQET